MLNLSNISLHLGARVLFENISLTIFDQQKVGLIGANGTGKSSLFKCNTGGNISQRWTNQYFSQFTHCTSGTRCSALSKSALDFVMDGDKQLRELEGQLKQAEQGKNYDLIAELHQKLIEIDGYSAPARAAKLLYGLGFNVTSQQKAVKDFSGGWRTRLNLAQTLMCPADMLLLDEPTNHLDLDAILWLEKWLQRYPGTLLIVSHDRMFLDKCIDHIIHIENHQLKTYSGNYSEFESLRAAQLALQQKTYEKQQKKIAHLEDFIRRFRAKASKAKQAQSRIKAIENRLSCRGANRFAF